MTAMSRKSARFFLSPAPTLTRLAALGLILPLTTIAVAACGSSSSSKGKAASNASAVSGKHISIVAPTLEPGYYRQMACGAQKKGGKLGLDVNQLQGPTVGWNVAEEANVMRAALATNPDGLIYTPAEGGAPGAEPIESAVSGGLPVANVDAQLSNSSLYMSYVGSSQAAGGKTDGELLAKQVGEEGEVIAIGVLPSNPITIGRIDGFKEALAKYPKVKLVATGYPPYEPSAIVAEATALLTKHPTVKAFYTTDEVIANGVATALRHAHKTGKVKIVTWDLETLGIKLMKEGVVTGTVAQKPRQIGEIAVEQLARKLEGKTTEKTIDVPVVPVTNEAIDAPTTKALYYEAACD